MGDPIVFFFADMSQQGIKKVTPLCGDITSDKLKELEASAQLLALQDYHMDARYHMWHDPLESDSIESDSIDRALLLRHHPGYHMDARYHKRKHHFVHADRALIHMDSDYDYCRSTRAHDVKQGHVGIIDRCDQYLKLDEIVLLSRNLKYASSVFLNNCNIGDKGCEILASGLLYYKSLKNIALSANAISDVGAMHLAKVSISLQSLDLSYNRIGDPGAIVLAEGLQNLTGLEALDLRYNLIGDEGAITLAKSIRIPKLRIWNHKISQSGADSISLNHAVDEPFGILILDDVYDVEMSILASNIQESPEQCNVIVLQSVMKLSTDSIKIIEHCHNLQSLTIRHSIRTSGVKALADGLKHCISLQTLNLSLNNIGHKGVKALADGLKHFTSLQTLDLRIDNNGVKVLADGLKHCTSLHTLKLSRSRIGDDGVKALADGLKHYSSLQTLDLRIDNNGVKVLADGLKHCTSLHTLKLSRSRIGDDGVKALAGGLKHCTSLQTLDLSRNSIGNDSIKALVDGLKHCTNLQRLNLLWNNTIGDDYLRAIANGLEQCTIVH